jgi:hypothetical protein
MLRNLILSLCLIIGLSQISLGAPPVELPGNIHLRHFHQPASFPVEPYVSEEPPAPSRGTNGDGVGGHWENEKQIFRFEKATFNGDQLDVNYFGEITYDNVKVGSVTVEKPTFKIERRGGSPLLPLDYMLPSTTFYFHYDKSGNPVWSEQERKLNLEHLKANLEKFFTIAHLKTLIEVKDHYEDNVFNLNGDKFHEIAAKVARATTGLDGWAESRRQLVFEKTREHIINYLSRPEIMDKLFLSVFKYFPPAPFYGGQDFDLVLERTRAHYNNNTKVAASYRIRAAGSKADLPNSSGEPATLPILETPDKNQAYLIADTTALTAVVQRYLASLDEKHGAKEPIELPEGFIFHGHEILVRTTTDDLKAVADFIPEAAAEMAKDSKVNYILTIPASQEPSVTLYYTPEKQIAYHYIAVTLNFTLKNVADLNAKGVPFDLQLTYTIDSSGAYTPRGVFPGAQAQEKNGRPQGGSVHSPMVEALNFIPTRMIANLTPEELAKAHGPNKKGTAIVGISTTQGKIEGPLKFGDVDIRDYLTITFRVDADSQKPRVILGTAATPMP